MSTFEYAVLRAVPQVQRGELVNVGVVLYCQDRDFLRALTHVDEARLRMLDGAIDLDALAEALQAVCRTCEGDGPAGATSLGQRFRWLTAPRSTVLQTGQVHAGLTDDPAAELERLVEQLVR
ncbi:MAG: hypothetical protein JWN77_1801 [Frankiales bacterium]|nr:hypothetical protein [Frankiales bacterium]